MLSSKQRVLAALNKEQPDKVPIVESIDWPIQLKLAEILGLSVGPKNKPFREMDLNCRLAEALELDWVDSYHSTGQVPISETHVKDKYGCILMVSEHGCAVPVDGPIKEAKDLIGYMLMSSNSIHPGVKPENHIAMVRAGHQYGVYP